MSSSRRIVHKPPPRPASAVVNEVNVVSSEHDSVAPLPKHSPFPQVQGQSEIVAECLTFVATIVAMGGQYLEMYRTVWWLPEMHNHQALHLHLIDKHVLVFIVAILGRKFFYAIFMSSLERFLVPRITRASYSLYTKLYMTVLAAILGYCSYEVYQKYGYLYFLSLGYPIVVYLVVFRFTSVQPFLRTIFEKQYKAAQDSPIHCCSTNPCDIRTEIDTLILRFNDRLKQTILSSLMSGYYAGCVPYWFIDKHLDYNGGVVSFNAIFIWITAFTLCAVQCFPMTYCDVLHRSAQHLGAWTRVECKSNAVPWTESSICNRGTVVCHNEDWYRADAPITTAVPGDISHARFYAIFKRPTLFYVMLLSIQLALMAALFLSIYYTTVWHTVIALGFLIFTNFYTLFSVLRNVIVTQSIYSFEPYMSSRGDYDH